MTASCWTGPLPTRAETVCRFCPDTVTTAVRPGDLVRVIARAGVCAGQEDEDGGGQKGALQGLAPVSVGWPALCSSGAPALRVLPGPRRRADATIVSRMADTGQTARARHESPVSDPPRMPAGRLCDRDRLLADPAADIRVLRLTRKRKSA